MRIQDASCKHFAKSYISVYQSKKSVSKKVIVRKSFAMSSTSYRISESQIEVPNFLIKKQNRSKTKAKAYFFFWSLRGRGKLIRDDFFSRTRAFPYFIFFSEPQNEAPTCVVQDFRKKNSENGASVGRGSIFAG